MKSKPSNGYRVNNHSRVPLIKGAFFYALTIRFMAKVLINDMFPTAIIICFWGLLRFIIIFAINT